jgi:CheY-like chemotaxis protein
MSHEETPKVLVAEDDGLMAKIMKSTLDGLGCDVFLVENGTHAVDVFRRHQDWHLVILDYQMPIMGGLEVLLFIRRSHPELPVVMMTGASHESVVAEFFRSGASCVLNKPFATEELKEVLSKFACLEGSGLANQKASPQVVNRQV